MEGGNATEYAELLARGINLIKNSKIVIGSITVDGGRAQLKALSFEWTGSLRNRYIDDGEYIKKFMLITVYVINQMILIHWLIQSEN